MIKFLLLVAVGVWLYLMFKRNQGVAGQNRPMPPQNAAPEDMVRCVECGVHLPRSESIMSQGEFFCCDEHRRKHQR